MATKAWLLRLSKAGRCLRSTWMKPTGACSNVPIVGLSGLGRRLRPWRTRERWMALRESLALTQRRRLGDVVEWKLQACSQLTDKRLFQRGETDRQCLWRVRAVGNAGTTAPAPDCGLADAQLSRQFCDRPFAALNVTADLRCGRGVGVQAQLHDARRSRIYEMPRSTPIPSNQSPETKHASGGPVNSERAIGAAAS